MTGRLCLDGRDYFLVAQDAHRQSWFGQGSPHFLQQHSLFPHLHSLQTHCVLGLSQPHVLPHAAHNGITLNSSATARTPIVFMIFPFPWLRPKPLSGVSVLPVAPALGTPR
jgi:hypothetical protein